MMTLIMKNRISNTPLGILLAIIAVLMASVDAFADGKLRVAVFDPSTSGNTIDNDTKLAVRELIGSALVNSGDYIILERSMLDKVMKESKFTNTAAVNESQATELGKLAGANKVVLSVVSKAGRKNMLSVKMIDVATAEVERQKAKVVAPDNLFDEVEPLVMAMIGYDATTAPRESGSHREYAGSEPAAQADPADTADASPSLKDSGTTGDGTIIEVYCDDPRGGMSYLDPEAPDVSGEGLKLKILYSGINVPVIHSEMPDIYVKVNPGAQRDYIRLIPLKANKKERQYIPTQTVGGIGALLATTANAYNSMNLVTVEISHRGNDVYRLTPQKKLKKGHYAVAYIPDFDSSNPPSPVIYSFEVKK